MILSVGNGAFHFSKNETLVLKEGGFDCVNCSLLRKSPPKRFGCPFNKLRWGHCNLPSFCWNPLSPSQSANAPQQSSLSGAGVEFIPTVCLTVWQLSQTTPQLSIVQGRASSGTRGSRWRCVVSWNRQTVTTCGRTRIEMKLRISERMKIKNVPSVWSRTKLAVMPSYTQKFDLLCDTIPNT